MNVVGLVGMWAGPRRHGSHCFCDAQIENNKRVPGPKEVILCWAGEEIVDPPEEPGITFMGRPGNEGWSYGSWCYAALQRPEADAFILWEDDYAPDVQGYAEMLAGKWHPGEYHASLVWDVGNRFGYHAALSHGIIDGDILRRMAPAFLEADYRDADAQVLFSDMAMEYGARLLTLHNEYATVYRDGGSDVHYYYFGDRVDKDTRSGMGGPLLFRSLWLDPSCRK